MDTQEQGIWKVPQTQCLILIKTFRYLHQLKLKILFKTILKIQED